MSDGVRRGHSLAFASSDVGAAMWLHRPLMSCPQQCCQIQTCPVQGQQIATSNADEDLSHLKVFLSHIR